MSSDTVAANGGIPDVVQVFNPTGTANILLVCEHGSNHIPEEFHGLGLTPEARRSHVAWDPGALAVARNMGRALNAPLIASRISRLVYDCNRPPEAADAMPARSEQYDIPGNADLDPAARAARTATYYQPFRDTVAKTIATTAPAVLVTVHSFTPVYMGKPRQVEIGILHDADRRLADAMMAAAGRFTPLNVQANAPYGPRDGVTHTLKTHGIGNGILNVMLEIRNDLIATPAQQDAMATTLCHMLNAALDSLAAPPRKQATPW